MIGRQFHQGSKSIRTHASIRSHDQNYIKFQYELSDLVWC